ncbi:tripartite tricarboxylate transporter substrate binding protein [Nitratireductor indicus]|nr:tripartite tricarboxylate transporter substrate binding protein [Nitratireductor indicus]MDS1137129.1 tripartite tricarboxylate transporter substrate binding protein [Nitratireductor indicus]SFQ24657.1 Tripartite-type tricarboxylate transporter, receptor component TctC [Nitratireductor indicus]
MLRNLMTAAAAVLISAGPALADWPEKPLELLVAYGAGGGTDVTARTLQPLLEKELGQSIVVVNRPGAAGEVGHAALADAKPDGYTMGILNLPPMLTIPITKDAAFKPEQIIPVAGLVRDPSAISVPGNSPFNTLEELIAYAKENPGAVTIGTTGVGTDDHLAMRYLAKATGAEFTHVPFASAGAARTALMGGHVSAAALNLGEAMPNAQEGKVKILAQFGPETSPLAPDVPTAKSLGYDVEMLSERGVGVPAGTDPAIVEKLAAAIEAVAKNPAFIERNKELYTEVSYMPTEAFQKHVEQLRKDYQAMWDESPWQ